MTGAQWEHTKEELENCWAFLVLKQWKLSWRVMIHRRSEQWTGLKKWVGIVKVGRMFVRD